MVFLLLLCVDDLDFSVRRIASMSSSFSRSWLRTSMASWTFDCATARPVCMKEIVCVCVCAFVNILGMNEWMDVEG
jgi:hypothetical protein